MPFTVIITKDFQQMSEEGAKAILADMKAFQPTAEKKKYVLGLATGNTPTGVYQYLADNQKEFDASQIISFNLDEYVGLPGENAQLRAMHPESYSYFMIQELFSKLDKKFAKTYVPYGTLIDQEKLIKELEAFKNDPAAYEIQGEDKGKAIVIAENSKSDYLKWIKDEILDGYTKAIEEKGGIDLHIIGVGGRGHVAFHESGIPFEGNKVILVKLDDNTVENAVSDGHFKKKEDSPNYAISMAAEQVYKAKTVLLFANGERKIGPITESLLGEITPDVPISYGQKFAKEGGNMVYVIDEKAAQGIMGKIEELKAKGIDVIDKR